MFEHYNLENDIKWLDFLRIMNIEKIKLYIEGYEVEQVLFKK